MDSISKALLLFAASMKQIESEVMTCEQLKSAMLACLTAHEE